MPLAVVTLPLEGSPPSRVIRVKVDAVDSTGRRTSASFEFTLERDGKEVVNEDDY